MNKIFLLPLIGVALAGCLEEKGLKVGTILQDCASIAPNQREEAARAIKGLKRDDAIRVISAKYGVSAAAAGDCLK